MPERLHRCYYPEISSQDCHATFEECAIRQKSGICRVKFIVENTAREKARLAYCKMIGKCAESNIEFCTSAKYDSYCGACEDFLRIYDEIKF